MSTLQLLQVEGELQPRDLAGSKDAAAGAPLQRAGWSGGKQVAPRLSAVPPPGPVDDPLEEIRLVIDDYVSPAVAALKRSAADGDLDAVRVYAFEVLAVTGTVVAACPPPRRRP